MFEIRYSRTERLLYRLAFATQKLQIILSEMEDDANKNELSTITVNKPVFIAGLPRAGTTILLDICVRAGGFASHTYRQMPFLHTPIFWKSFTKRFAADEAKQERAHGDGVMIDMSSPEALEEILWKPFWKKQYQPNSIALWPVHAESIFSIYFKQHIRKLLSINSNPTLRYVSKNNLNIARFPYLRSMFDDAFILVPFRKPLQQAFSLLLQHLNFSKMHIDDPFSRIYMEAIGHYDFGANLRPINFNAWLEEHDGLKPNCLDFWLTYWHNAYSHILSVAKESGLLFVSFDSLCASAEQGLEAIRNAIEASSPEGFRGQSTTLRSPRVKPIDSSSYSDEIYRKCESLYGTLQATAIF